MRRRYCDENFDMEPGTEMHLFASSSEATTLPSWSLVRITRREDGEFRLTLDIESEDLLRRLTKLDMYAQKHFAPKQNGEYVPLLRAGSASRPPYLRLKLTNNTMFFREILPGCYTNYSDVREEEVFGLINATVSTPWKTESNAYGISLLTDQVLLRRSHTTTLSLPFHGALRKIHFAAKPKNDDDKDFFEDL